jgi:pimeloyl-ACP methyl ester carboxylesterase
VERPLLWKYLARDMPKPAPKQDSFMSVLTSPEYSLLDAWRTQKGLFWTLGVMWNQLLTVNLIKQVPCIDTPVYLFEGRRDYQVPFQLAEEWFAGLKAPRKEIVWFDRSGHDMFLDEPARFQRVLIDQVLPQTYGRSFPSACKVASPQ